MQLQAQAPKQPTQPQPASKQEYTQVEIKRRHVGTWASVFGSKETTIHGGVLTTLIRFHRNSLPSDSDEFKELKYNEYLVLQTANKTRCYIPIGVINQIGFDTIEEFHSHLVEADISIVECISEISASLNVASNLVLYYDFKR
jgi:hypothetical protein